MSEEKTFDDPQRIVLNRIYTRTGDSGETALVGGQRIRKDAPRIESYGTVDELNATLGLARTTTNELASRYPALAPLAAILNRVQHELFNLGSILATLPDDVGEKQPRITASDVKQLEREIDEMNRHLPVLRSFVLPGGSRLEAELHLCRTICRRAERVLVSFAVSEPVPDYSIEYLNRLSDALFVWSRWVNKVIGAEEALWTPNAAVSGSATA